MCRQADKKAGRLFPDNPAGDWCTALGQDRSKWDKDCLLRPIGDDDPYNQVDEFVKALADLCRDKTLNKKKLDAVEEAAQHEKFKKWYTEHGKMSGNFRASVEESKLRIAHPNGRKKIPDDLVNKVLARDNYCCQYCGCRLIVKEVWKKLEELSSSHGHDIIKRLNQRRGVKDEEVTGLIFATWPFADHVLAHKRGGCTNMENLVASCFACNYGKDDFTCDELGIRNPLSNPKGIIINSDGSSWDGLKEFIGPLDIFIRHCPIKS